VHPDGGAFVTRILYSRNLYESHLSLDWKTKDFSHFSAAPLLFKFGKSGFVRNVYRFVP